MLAAAILAAIVRGLYAVDEERGYRLALAVRRARGVVARRAAYLLDEEMT